MARRSGVPEVGAAPRRARSLALRVPVALALAWAFGLLFAPAAAAQTMVAGSGPNPVLVDGLEPQRLPAEARAGSEVCVQSTRYYSSEGERWTFLHWSNGSGERCVIASGSGVLRPVYKREVLLHVKSAASGLQQSRWVEYGQPAEVEVPETVAVVGEGERSRYKFQQWSDGETMFQPRNTIAPLKPTTLEARWIKEYQITIESPPQVQILGTGWYPDGGQLVLQAPDIVPGETREERWKFARWEGVGTPIPVIPNPEKPFTTVKVDNSYTIRAVYEKQYLVNARNPLGTIKRDWYKEGQEVVLETPPIIEVTPERERYVFRRWEGLDGLLSPKISGQVDRPVIITAKYDHEVMVNLISPHGGSGGGWQTEGTTITVAVPPSASQYVFLRSTFAGFPGYGATQGQSSVQVLVREPMVIVALYRTEPDFLVLSFVLLFGLGVALIYHSPRWVPLLPERARENKWIVALSRRVQRLPWRVRRQPRRP